MYKLIDDNYDDNERCCDKLLRPLDMEKCFFRYLSIFQIKILLDTWKKFTSKCYKIITLHSYTWSQLTTWCYKNILKCSKSCMIRYCVRSSYIHLFFFFNLLMVLRSLGYCDLGYCALSVSLGNSNVKIFFKPKTKIMIFGGSEWLLSQN